MHVCQKYFGKSASSGSEKSIFTLWTKRSLLLLMLLMTVNLCHLFESEFTSLYMLFREKNMLKLSQIHNGLNCIGSCYFVIRHL